MLHARHWSFKAFLSLAAAVLALSFLSAIQKDSINKTFSTRFISNITIMVLIPVSLNFNQDYKKIFSALRWMLFLAKYTWVACHWKEYLDSPLFSPPLPEDFILVSGCHAAMLFGRGDKSSFVGCICFTAGPIWRNIGCLPANQKRACFILLFRVHLLFKGRAINESKWFNWGDSKLSKLSEVRQCDWN